MFSYSLINPAVIIIQQIPDLAHRKIMDIFFISCLLYKLQLTFYYFIHTHVLGRGNKTMLEMHRTPNVAPYIYDIECYIHLYMEPFGYSRCMAY